MFQLQVVSHPSFYLGGTKYQLLAQPLVIMPMPVKPGWSGQSKINLPWHSGQNHVSWQTSPWCSTRFKVICWSIRFQNDHPVEGETIATCGHSKKSTSCCIYRFHSWICKQIFLSLHYCPWHGAPSPTYWRLHSLPIDSILNWPWSSKQLNSWASWLASKTWWPWPKQSCQELTITISSLYQYFGTLEGPHPCTELLIFAQLYWHSS